MRVLSRSFIKDLERGRLILDSRPANWYEDGPKDWVQTRASAATLADVALSRNEVLACCGEYLRDFFYQFRTSRMRTCRNVLAQPLTMAQARVVFGPSFQWPVSSLVWSFYIGYGGHKLMRARSMCTCESLPGWWCVRTERDVDAARYDSKEPHNCWNYHR